MSRRNRRKRTFEPRIPLEERVYGICPRCKTREVFHRKVWHDGFGPLCKACGDSLVPQETWQKSGDSGAPAQHRLRCALCRGFLRSGNPGPYCSPCKNTMLERGVHVLCVPRRVRQTDLSA
jgi:hypothetical protein